MISLNAEFGREFQGRRVLVTGATGFIGRNLCEALKSLGAEVTGLSRSATPGGLPDGVAPLAVDLVRQTPVVEGLACARPELIFHLAGHVTTQPDRALVLPMFEANAAGTVNLLLAASERRCERLILVGSSEAAGVRGDLAPNSPYGASKLVAEIYGQMFHRLYELPVVCLRPFLTYGPWQEPTKLIPYTILKLLQCESPLLSSGERVCDIIYVADVVRGLLRAAVASSGVLGARIDLGTGSGITIRELVERLVKLMDSTIAPIFGGVPDRPGDEPILADIGRTRSLLGWTPQWPLEDGLRGTVMWYRQHRQWGEAL